MASHERDDINLILRKIKSDKLHFKTQLCSGSCIHGIAFLHIQNMNLLSAALITQERMHQFLIFQKLRKNLSRAASPQGPHWCIMKDCDFSVCIWYGVFLAATRESQLWENCKRERQDELLGLQKSCQKPFLSMLCPTDIHLASWKVKTAKTSSLKRTFQLLRDTLQQEWVFEKKKKKPWNSRNGRDFQTEAR